jgi:hypothetical protein
MHSLHDRVIVLEVAAMCAAALHAFFSMITCTLSTLCTLSTYQLIHTQPSAAFHAYVTDTATLLLARTYIVQVVVQ